MNTWNDAEHSNTRPLFQEPTGGVTIRHIMTSLAPETGLSTVVVKSRTPFPESTLH